MANSATLRIRHVKCVDETGGGFAEKFGGNDEIKCAVFSADLLGTTLNSGRIDIYDDFDDGDVKKFNPPKPVVNLDLAGKTGQVEVAFTVLLIESQWFEGEGLNKAWAEWLKIYNAALKDEVMKRGLSLDQAYAAVKPGYLATPKTDPGTVPGRVRGTGHVDVLGGAGTMAISRTGSPGTASVLGDGDEKTGEKKESTYEKSVDAFWIALVAAVAVFTLKFGGLVLNKLVDWSKDKYFPPMEVKAKFDPSTVPEGAPPVASGVVSTAGYGGIYELEWEILVH